MASKHVGTSAMQREATAQIGAFWPAAGDAACGQQQAPGHVPPSIQQLLVCNPPLCSALGGIQWDALGRVSKASLVAILRALGDARPPPLPSPAAAGLSTAAVSAFTAACGMAGASAGTAQTRPHATAPLCAAGAGGCASAGGAAPQLQPACAGRPAATSSAGSSRAISLRTSLSIDVTSPRVSGSSSGSEGSAATPGSATRGSAAAAAGPPAAAPTTGHQRARSAGAEGPDSPKFHPLEAAATGGVQATGCAPASTSPALAAPAGVVASSSSRGSKQPHKRHCSTPGTALGKPVSIFSVGSGGHDDDAHGATPQDVHDGAGHEHLVSFAADAAEAGDACHASSDGAHQNPLRKGHGLVVAHSRAAGGSAVEAQPPQHHQQHKDGHAHRAPTPGAALGKPVSIFSSCSGSSTGSKDSSMAASGAHPPSPPPSPPQASDSPSRQLQLSASKGRRVSFGERPVLICDGITLAPAAAAPQQADADACVGTHVPEARAPPPAPAQLTSIARQESGQSVRAQAASMLLSKRVPEDAWASPNLRRPPTPGGALMWGATGADSDNDSRASSSRGTPGAAGDNSKASSPAGAGGMAGTRARAANLLGRLSPELAAEVHAGGERPPTPGAALVDNVFAASPGALGSGRSSRAGSVQCLKQALRSAGSAGDAGEGSPAAQHTPCQPSVSALRKAFSTGQPQQQQPPGTPPGAAGRLSPHGAASELVSHNADLALDKQQQASWGERLAQRPPTPATTPGRHRDDLFSGGDTDAGDDGDAHQAGQAAGRGNRSMRPAPTARDRSPEQARVADEAGSERETDRPGRRPSSSDSSNSSAGSSRTSSPLRSMRAADDPAPTRPSPLRRSHSSTSLAADEDSHESAAPGAAPAASPASLAAATASRLQRSACAADRDPARCSPLRRSSTSSPGR